MSGRRLQERLLDNDGRPLTEWDDATMPDGIRFSEFGATDKDWRTLVSYLNAQAKERGDNTRWRSVEVDE